MMINKSMGKIIIALFSSMKKPLIAFLPGTYPGITLLSLFTVYSTFYVSMNKICAKFVYNNVVYSELADSSRFARVKQIKKKLYLTHYQQFNKRA